MYVLAQTYQKIKPHDFVVANRLDPHSYVSLETARSYFDCIPDGMPATTSVTRRRPAYASTPVGRFIFRRIAFLLTADVMPDGVEHVEIAPGQVARLATPERALVDLLYLHPDADDPGFLYELRLQNLDIINPLLLIRFASMADRRHHPTRPKLMRAVEQVCTMIVDEQVSVLS